MGLISWLQKALSPAKLTQPVVARGKPLHEQFQRIGGGLTPADVSSILRQADGGQPASFVDLTNESRQKDGHLQSTLGTRDTAVGLVDLEFIEPKDATPEEKKATDLCRRVRDDFVNWPTLVEHLTGAYLPGHATCEVLWRKTNDGLLLPYQAQPIHAREFIFARQDGALRFRSNVFDTVGIDLLAENPGRIVQVQRRIVGDVPAREGLARVLVWAALMRNWTLRDWVALGEIGWKPWRIGEYEPGTHQADIDAFIIALERIGSDGIGAFPKGTGLKVEWPKGQSAGSTSVHGELFGTLGREISKAVLGQTTSVEAGPNGDRGGVKARDELRTDIREGDARSVASALRHHLFTHVVAINVSPSARVPAPWFQTEESADQKAFSEAVKNLQEAGLRIPAKWVRDEVGMPEPLEGEEVLEPTKTTGQVPDDIGDDKEDPDDDDDGSDKSARRKGDEPEPLPERGARNGLEYSDRLTDSAGAAGAQALAPTLAAVLTQISKAEGYEDALRLVEGRYGTLASPADLKVLVEADLILAHIAGAAAVRQDTPELDDEA